ncbi:MAG TPA: histidine kinase dimerization/phospho-acceptor domain-containing protein, partial [Pseudomonadales bacterium]|nr:histidine kinase dimerization/phospho-acceptor domain-containing protein [Pseudomonadales bacterium]
MTRIFLKLYGGILAAFLVLFIVSYWIILGINANRYSQYQQSLAQGVTALIAEQVVNKQRPEAEQWLIEINAQFNLDAKVLTFEKSQFGRRQLDRLYAGLLVVEEVEREGFKKNLLFYKLPKKSLLLTLDLNAAQADLPSLSAYLINNYFLQQGAASPSETLNRISNYFSYPLNLFSRSALTLSTYQLEHLNRHKTLLSSRHGIDKPLLIIALPDGSNYLSIGPIQSFEPYPFSIVLVIVVFDTMLLGLVAYLLVHPIERRLKVLAKTANQIQGGHLDVRATIDSSDAIGMLAAAFNAMAEHIQMLLDMQKEMIRAISHELRTPVARLRFSLQLIEDAQSDQERLPLLQGMDGDMEQLDELIDEILTYARMEQATPEMQFSLLDVDEVIDRVIKEMGQAANKAGVSLEHIPESLPVQHRRVESDPRYIHRVVQNFVGNAIRYAKSNVRVSFV